VIKIFAFLILALAFRFCVASVDERSFSSCEDNITVVSSGFDRAIIVINGKKRSFKVGHSADGGAINQSKSSFIIYGNPRVIDAQYPQTIIISVFKSLKRPKLRSRITVGGGVYDVSFSRDGKFGLVNYKYGTLVIDLRNYKNYLATSTVPGIFEYPNMH
jgi:hypothetical protein